MEFSKEVQERFDKICESKKIKASRYIISDADKSFIDSLIPKNAVGATQNLDYHHKVHWIKTKLQSFLSKQQEYIKFPTSYATCKLCEYKSGNLFSHILKVHNISIDGYRNLYGQDIQLASTEYLVGISKRVLGDKNPAYHHNGRLSPYSKKFIGYDNLSDEDRKNCIDKVKEKKKQSSPPEKQSTRIEYYLSKGMSQSDAQKALSERQRTFYLDKCIEEYGVEEGIRIWQERQDKWQSTLTSKPDAEQQEINIKKIFNNGISNAEKELFEELKSIYPYATNQHQIKFYDSENNKTKWYMYDIKIGNAIIEFNGDFWHRNPKLYTESYEVMLYGKLSKTIDIWAKDKHKREVAESNGFKYYVVWEKDYRKDYENTMEVLIKFINENK